MRVFFILLEILRFHIEGKVGLLLVPCCWTIYLTLPPLLCRLVDSFMADSYLYNSSVQGARTCWRCEMVKLNVIQAAYNIPVDIWPSVDIIMRLFCWIQELVLTR